MDSTDQACKIPLALCLVFKYSSGSLDLHLSKLCLECSSPAPELYTTKLKHFIFIEMFFEASEICAQKLNIIEGREMTVKFSFKTFHSKRSIATGLSKALYIWKLFWNRAFLTEGLSAVVKRNCQTLFETICSESRYLQHSLEKLKTEHPLWVRYFFRTSLHLLARQHVGWANLGILPLKIPPYTHT